MVIPSPGRVREILETYQVPPHIVLHSEIVRKVALFIVSSLNEMGIPIDTAAVEAASLLHDLCKMDAIHLGGDHALMAQEELFKLGYPFIGEIVGQHVRLKSLEINEAMVVNYADKRVMHDRIVSLSERFDDLVARYGTDDYRRKRIREHYRDLLKVEEIIATYCRNLEDLSDLSVSESVSGSLSQSLSN